MLTFFPSLDLTQFLSPLFFAGRQDPSKLERGWPSLVCSAQARLTGWPFPGLCSHSGCWQDREDADFTKQDRSPELRSCEDGECVRLELRLVFQVQVPEKVGVDLGLLGWTVLPCLAP